MTTLRTIRTEELPLIKNYDFHRYDTNTLKEIANLRNLITKGILEILIPFCYCTISDLGRNIWFIHEIVTSMWRVWCMWFWFRIECVIICSATILSLFKGVLPSSSHGSHGSHAAHLLILLLSNTSCSLFHFTTMDSSLTIITRLWSVIFREPALTWYSPVATYLESMKLSSHNCSLDYSTRRVSNAGSK